MTHHLLKLAGEGIFQAGEGFVRYTEADRVPYRAMVTQIMTLKVGETYVFPYINGHPDMRPECKRVRYYIEANRKKNKEEAEKVYSLKRDFHKSAIMITRKK